MAEDTVDARASSSLDGLPAVGPAQPHPPSCACAAPTAAAPTAAATATWPTATAARPGCCAAMVDADPTLGEPLVPGLPYLRAEAVLRRAPRDGHARSTTSSPAAPGPGCSGRDATAAAAADVAALLGRRARLDAPTSGAAQAAAYRRRRRGTSASAGPARDRGAAPRAPIPATDRRS